MTALMGPKRRVRDRFYAVSSRKAQKLPQSKSKADVRSLLSHGIIPHTAHRDIQRIGQKLFKLAVHDAKDLRRELRTRDLSTRLWFVLDETSHAQPWELVCDTAGGPGNFLARNRNAPVIRALSRPSSRDRMTEIAGPLKVLGVIATPKGRPALATRKEKRALENALGEARRQGLVQVEWITGRDTVRQLRQQLRKTWHVVHFICHGDFDPAQ